VVNPTPLIITSSHTTTDVHSDKRLSLIRDISRELLAVFVQIDDSKIALK